MALAEYHGKPCPRCGEGHSENDPSCRSLEAGFFAERLAAWNRYKEEAAARRVGWEDVVLTALLADDAAGMQEALTAFPEYVNVRVHNVLTGGGELCASDTCGLTCPRRRRARSRGCWRRCSGSPSRLASQRKREGHWWWWVLAGFC